MHYLMLPLEQHYDDGFGATAEAFLEAAATLRKAESKTVFFEHLPQSYLLRHAVELFLKSGIIIIHRRLKIPFDTQPSTSQPRVLTPEGWKPIYRVHSIGDLYGHWKSIVTRNAQTLQALCKHKPDWTVPAELDHWIDTIEKTDPDSTYYRYPITRDPAADKNKSSFKEVPVDNLFPADMPEDKRVRALVIKNEEGEFVRAFALDESTDQTAMAALTKAAEELNNWHAMMRIELTGGW